MKNRCYFGDNTLKAMSNFAVGDEKMPHEIIYSLALIKKAAALTNCQLKCLSKDKCNVICLAADEIMAGKLNNQFPLLIWQSGSGTQTNMNVNEVIAKRAAELGGNKKIIVHPNDDVNMSQSSNDTFIAAMHMATLFYIEEYLLPSILLFKNGLDKKKKEFSSVIKVGRTHLMDAVPISLGQEISAFGAQIEQVIISIQWALLRLRELPLGGTAVGTGINANVNFSSLVIDNLNKMKNGKFKEAENKFAAISSSNTILFTSSILKELAIVLMKLAKDFSYLASGPRCGIGEIEFAFNEPGSSIMPGKVNPTQCELLRMIASQVMGNDLVISVAALQADLQLHACRPVMIFNLLQSLKLLSEGMNSFYQKCLISLKPNMKTIKKHLDDSLMIVTALSHHIGYDKACMIVKMAIKKNLSIKEAARELKILSKEELEQILDYRQMI